jgi:hypothetical protein
MDGGKLIGFPTLGELMDKRRDELFEAWWQSYTAQTSYDDPKNIAHAFWNAGYEAGQARLNAAMATLHEPTPTTRMVRVTDQSGYIPIAMAHELTFAPGGEPIQGRAVMMVISTTDAPPAGNVYMATAEPLYRTVPYADVPPPLPPEATPKRGYEFI